MIMRLGLQWITVVFTPGGDIGHLGDSDTVELESPLRTDFYLPTGVILACIAQTLNRHLRLPGN